jgi:hypothetical protein
LFSFLIASAIVIARCNGRPTRHSNEKQTKEDKEERTGEDERSKGQQLLNLLCVFVYFELFSFKYAKDQTRNTTKEDTQKERTGEDERRKPIQHCSP